jgi:hypothetical protein
MPAADRHGRAAAVGRLQGGLIFGHLIALLRICNTSAEDAEIPSSQIDQLLQFYQVS